MTKFLFMVVILNLLCKIDARSANQYENLVEVPFGDTVTLECESNVENYTFFYWFLNDRSIIIGPSSDEYNYNSGKFRYEVLSGNLTVKDVSKAEEGVYNCVSRGVIKDDVNIRSVRMLVQTSWEEVYEHDPSVSTQSNSFCFLSSSVVLLSYYNQQEHKEHLFLVFIATFLLCTFFLIRFYIFDSKSLFRS